MLRIVASVIRQKKIFSAASYSIKAKYYFNFYSSAKMESEYASQFQLPNSVPYANLDCSEAFNELTTSEKQYAHFLSHACYEGSLIVLLQTSPESPAIFLLFQKLFSAEPIDCLKKRAQGYDTRITDDDWLALLTYAGGFYSNMGNYKSFGDTKIIPAISKDKFKSAIWSSKAFEEHGVLLEPLWLECNDAIYSLTQQRKELALDGKGISTYYSSNCGTEDANFIKDFMNEKEISPYNTRLFKSISTDGAITYEVRLASAAVTAENCMPEDDVASLLGNHSFKGKTVAVSRGDYSPLMARIVSHLRKALAFASNENEREMIKQYIVSFSTGSINAHKRGSGFWIKDKGPIVESYIGFIESYRDPFGMRGEFEGFVAVVNKAMSAKFSNLVENAENLLLLLPWGQDFEKDRFLKPDFTSLDVVTFAGSGIPAGINIPNYDDIRQNEGFKNVSLGNVLKCYNPNKTVTFLYPEDVDLYCKLRSPSFEVQVGLHELLGHGSGKLLTENKDGGLNFDKDTLLDPLTSSKVTSWYSHNETWDSKFAEISSSYEECRAECVGLYLCFSYDVLRIFGHEGESAEDIIYINWLNMVRAGLLGLEFYSPESKKWKQAHMQARYVILKVLLEASNDLVKIDQMTGEDGKSDLRITIDRSKLKTIGKDAIGNFLRKLQIYKSTADLNAGKKMYDLYSQVDETGPHGGFLAMRSIVLARKQERRLFIQAHTEIEGDEVKLREFAASPEGLISSFTTRFPYHDNELERLWCDDKKWHAYK